MNPVAHYVLTEWISETKTSDLTVHLYTLPVRNVFELHKENGHACSDLRKLNKSHVIDFFEHLIIAWKPIDNWGQYTFIKHETRSIDPMSSTERTVLERLLLRTIENVQPRNEIAAGRRKFTWLRAEKVVQNVSIHRVIQCDVTVNQEGVIAVGFDLNHSYRTNESVYDLLKENSITKGDRVIDKYNNLHYEFDEVSSATIDEAIPELKQSVIDYFVKERKQEWKVEKLDPKMPVVYVKMQNGLRAAYAPAMLQKELTFASLPTAVVRQTSDIYKQNANQKISTLLAEMQKILARTDKLTFSKQKLLVQQSGYEVKKFDNPNLSFGKSTTGTQPKYGLDKGGVIAPQPLSINLLVYPEFFETKLTAITSFTEKLSMLSQKWGVPLTILKKSGTYRNKPIDFTNPHQFAILLKELTNTAFQELTLVITTEKIAGMWYDAIKKEFGGNSSIPTQFVTMETLQKTDDYILGNILLGLYSKSGIQPWVLDSPLASDCFIGLDVSHEAGRHSAGIVQVVGKDGKVLSSKANTSNEAGEKIRHETMCQIVYSAIDQYRQHFKEMPKHITFHRDGVCREDLKNLDEVMNSLNVEYDMVEIIKKTNRRMALNVKKQGWETKQGICYIKDDLAYLIATNPHSRVGTAQPIKIIKKKGSLPIDAIIQDIYHLSFMHIGSFLKCRLPITTYYADLSSTFFNRQWLPIDAGESLHFV
ncbi:Piwi domain-containing protein [Paenibacillus sp. MZ04-78.2]|uniref:Piwi domain-containing protein n=1 Tax=Paenibacillus sp. MZ04-78.2 TaxID=2962034 RepID=UPI0020B6A3FF|nr:Piwi domain-containing protein [Paenibacillus sp. MZ04-78.2]MCP3776640.1 Piwi domain-containing protein [Paenibacillus sp. MZ04-78.2]